MAEGEDRTEAATPRRLQRARAEGSVAVSREVPALAGLGAATLLLATAGPGLGRATAGRLAPMLAGTADPPHALMAALLAAGLLALPVVAGVLVASSAAVLLQTGLVLSPAALMPDLSRLSPIRGLKRLFGPAGLVEAGKSLLKLGALGFAVFHVLSAGLPSLRGAALWRPEQLADRLRHGVLDLMLTVLGVQAVIAGADAWWVRHRHARGLRMSREEIRQEAKETDGNPDSKRRLRQLRTVRAKQRMLAAVPAATVVVTNPTHYAVALAYDRATGGAPRVVAKGVDEVAARIREVARDSRVPLVANPPLARALYTVAVDAEVPAEHFKVRGGDHRLCVAAARQGRAVSALRMRRWRRRRAAPSRRLIERLAAPLDDMLHVLLQESAAGLAIVDRHGRLVRVNEALRRMVDRSCDLSPGQPGAGHLLRAAARERCGTSWAPRCKAGGRPAPSSPCCAARAPGRSRRSRSRPSRCGRRTRR